VQDPSPENLVKLREAASLYRDAFEQHRFNHPCARWWLKDECYGVRDWQERLVEEIEKMRASVNRERGGSQRRGCLVPDCSEPVAPGSAPASCTPRRWPGSMPAYGTSRPPIRLGASITIPGIPPPRTPAAGHPSSPRLTSRRTRRHRQTSTTPLEAGDAHSGQPGAAAADVAVRGWPWPAPDREGRSIVGARRG